MIEMAGFQIHTSVMSAQNQIIPHHQKAFLNLLLRGVDQCHTLSWSGILSSKLNNAFGQVFAGTLLTISPRRRFKYNDLHIFLCEVIMTQTFHEVCDYTSANLLSFVRIHTVLPQETRDTFVSRTEGDIYLFGKTLSDHSATQDDIIKTTLTTSEDISSYELVLTHLLNGSFHVHQ